MVHAQTEMVTVGAHGMLLPVVGEMMLAHGEDGEHTRASTLRGANVSANRTKKRAETARKGSLVDVALGMELDAWATLRLSQNELPLVIWARRWCKGNLLLCARSIRFNEPYIARNTSENGL